MNAQYWLDLWDSNDIAFHQDAFNPLLVARFGDLGLATGTQVFVPLCGKTRDIAWLLSQGFAVSGAELSERAVRELFEELNVTPEITKIRDLTCYGAPGLKIFAGDMFALTAADLGPVAGVYDRAALVALPEDMRARYAAHLRRITGHAPQLLITFIYDQTAMEGPPFSLPAPLIENAYAAQITLRELARRTLPMRLKGQVEADEVAWHVI